MPAALAERIEALGYKVEVVDNASSVTVAQNNMKGPTPVPGDAPKFFRDAFASARGNGRPVMVDFWASWCGPCIRLRQETFENENVAKLLKGVEVVFVDLDKHPTLGDAYRVDSVPNVLLIDRGGFVVDRLRNFEPPELFAKRLIRFLERDTRSTHTKLKRTVTVP